MRRFGFAAILALTLLCIAVPGHSSDFYEWTDENGVTHFATSLEEVPAKYRDRVKRPDGQPVAKPLDQRLGHRPPSACGAIGAHSVRLPLDANRYLVPPVAVRPGNAHVVKTLWSIPDSSCTKVSDTVLGPTPSRAPRRRARRRPGRRWPRRATRGARGSTRARPRLGRRAPRASRRGARRGRSPGAGRSGRPRPPR